jgi:hypothetical protein
MLRKELRPLALLPRKLQMASVLEQTVPRLQHGLDRVLFKYNPVD